MTTDVFAIGNQRVGIVTKVPVLDGGGNPTYTPANEPITTESVIWKDGCLFEIQTPSEDQNMTVTTSAPAWAFFPVDTDTRVLVSGQLLRCPSVGDDDYAMRGDGVLENDIRGREHHVFAVCELEKG